MFRDDAQTHEALALLLAPLPALAGMWTQQGPTDRGVDAVSNRVALSTGETQMIRAAFDIWNGQGGASFGRLFHALDNDRLRDVASLILAGLDGPQSVDAWILARKGGA